MAADRPSAPAGDSDAPPAPADPAPASAEPAPASAEPASAQPAPASAEPAAASAEPGTDRLYVHGPSPRGEGYLVLRSRKERLEIGEMRILEQGRPIEGEVVQLKPIEGQERTFDVEVLLEAQQTRALGGPAQVASGAYRRNWEAIFGKARRKSPVAQADASDAPQDIDPSELN